MDDAIKNPIDILEFIISNISIGLVLIKQTVAPNPL